MRESGALNAGVLIIGSLLWDPHRQAWRDARLDGDEPESISAPIRYGRRSGRRRGNTYTMVFSCNAPAGRARVARYVHPITSGDDLITEAELLWEAEELVPNARRIAKNWGRVALLCNPERKIPKEILEAWAERVKREPEYRAPTQPHGEEPLVNQGGILRIEWPRLIGNRAAVDLDLLLATANNPTFTGIPPEYPRVETIVAAWNYAAPRHAEYFWKNSDHGITTFQDDEIRARLHPRQHGKA